MPARGSRVLDFVYLTNADTEVLAMRSVWEEVPPGFGLVVRAIDTAGDSGALAATARVVVVRLLGGVRAHSGFGDLAARCRKLGVPLVAYPGDASIDPEMLAASTVPAGVWKEGFAYLIQGGVENLASFVRFISDVVSHTGYGFAPVAEVPSYGRYRSNTSEAPEVGLLFYRAHLISGNLSFVNRFLEVASSMGIGAAAYFAYSLRDISDPSDSVIGMMRADGVEVLVATVLAGGSQDGLEWDAGPLGLMGVPVLQGIVATTSRSEWLESESGLRPMDVAMNVAIPEFDGRIVTVPIAFKERVDEDELYGTAITAYRLDEERAGYVLSLARRYLGLRRKPNSAKRIAVVLSAYPTKRSRLGNAVGLDTPASLLRLAAAMEERGYLIEGLPEDPVELMRRLGDLIDYHSPDTVAGGGLAFGATAYTGWFRGLPARVQREVEAAWGPPPGKVYLSNGELRFPAIEFGNLVVAIQPPRGFGDNPIAVYHSPELVPTHHYLAFYHFLEAGLGCDAAVHLGKHGTMEWLPGKSVGLSDSCYPAIAAGSLPVVYPFVINDPGEGTQAKRRSHATIVGHLVPPMTRAESHGGLSELEMLLDEHQRIAALDPEKLPAIRLRVWEAIASIQLNVDMGVEAAPDGVAFDDFLVDVDGYLCELKDALIRGGLHILGEAPSGQALVDLIVAITRVPQLDAPALRPALATGEGRSATDEMEARAEELVWELYGQDFDPRVLDDPGWLLSVGLPSPLKGELREALAWICSRLVPNLAATAGEVERVVDALAGLPVPPGPSGAPTRGMAHSLPTGRNFYSIDPRAIPTRLSWDTGWRLAGALIARYLEDRGVYPTSVGVVFWGTAAIRTGGDDLALALSLIGVEPIWDPVSQRIGGLRLIPPGELGRPRVDVTCKISGFFRDAFPHALSLLDEAFAMVAKEAGEGEANPLAEAGVVPRIFGPQPRSYGSGILPLLETRSWRDEGDLAEVYLAWSGFSYSRDAFGEPARDALSTRLAGMQVAFKAQDNREHDIFDSDDYLQEHGGMIAAARAAGNREIAGYFGDSAVSAAPKVRSIEEEAARVVRTRVVNPKWIDAMMRHGYKGAFEMAATVDYLFGYDATAGVARDWMYDAVVDRYVADAGVAGFIKEVNPQALASICERLLEAESRGMWRPSGDRSGLARSALLGVEGDEEERSS